MILSAEADALYDKHDDECVDFRKDNRKKKNKRSVLSKSKGLVLRVAGAIALLRSGMEIYLQRQVNYTISLEAIGVGGFRGISRIY